MKNSECIIEQYRGGKLVRAFIPTGDQTFDLCLERSRPDPISRQPLRAAVNHAAP
nr:hypothetical protein [Paucibacter sp. M5-1]MCZ7884379.1 hypothetical protein [Paucibacter sp. M5-1]